VEGDPPPTDVGLNVTVDTLGALIVSDPLALAPLKLAVRLAEAAVPTGVVGTLTVPEVAPAAITKDAGGVMAALLDDNVTVAPPAGAGSLNVTLAVPALPPTTDVGLNVTVLTPGGVIVRVAIDCAP
jgi:hypothetical protein